MKFFKEFFFTRHFLKSCFLCESSFFLCDKIQIIARSDYLKTSIGVCLCKSYGDFYFFVFVPLKFKARKHLSPFFYPIQFLTVISPPKIITGFNFLIMLVFYPLGCQIIFP